MNYKKDQQKYRDLTKPKFYPQGEKVSIEGWDEKKKAYVKKELPNDEGHHIAQISKRLVKLNRHQTHRKIVDRSFTKKNAKHSRTNAKPEEEKPILTNHQRMLIRKERRDARRKRQQPSAA